MRACALVYVCMVYACAHWCMWVYGVYMCSAWEARCVSNFSPNCGVYDLVF
eukprot:m.37912 g.37912  ORF g.37912 m.37912 type:complete len:51 (-) comp17782_c0_seq1:254-406(-)